MRSAYFTDIFAACTLQASLYLVVCVTEQCLDGCVGLIYALRAEIAPACAMPKCKFILKARSFPGYFFVTFTLTHFVKRGGEKFWRTL